MKDCYCDLGLHFILLDDSSQSYILKLRDRWWQSAEILEVSDRTMRRWRWRYQQHGYDGLYDRRKGKPSPKRVPLETAESVLQLYRHDSTDHNVRHFHQKLVEVHGIGLSYSWVKAALQG